MAGDAAGDCISKDKNPISPEVKADVPYVNAYCSLKHAGVVDCAWTPEKGRILSATRCFKRGEIIFQEPVLHIVAEKHGDAAFDRLANLCRNRPKVFDFAPLWYWTALCSLSASQLVGATGLGKSLKPIDDDQQRKLLLLYHPEVREPGAAVTLLVKEFGLSASLRPLDLERLLQVWILNCFEHSQEPLGYSTYFMSSFMSHSCLPNGIWHYDGDDFVLRARCAVEANDEICVSYLSEEALLESAPSRQSHLQSSKHFSCRCIRCDGEADHCRVFRCQSCGGNILPRPRGHQSGAGKEDSGVRGLEGLACGGCQEVLGEADSKILLNEERVLQTKLQGWERQNDNRVIGTVDPTLPKLIEEIREATAKAERVLAQHWLLDRAWTLLSDLCDDGGLLKEAEGYFRKRLDFQKKAYPGLSGARAWTLEAYADMLLRHRGTILEPDVRIPDQQAARALVSIVPPVYEECLDILVHMFGESHEYFTSVNRKAVQLGEQFERLLGMPHMPPIVAHAAAQGSVLATRGGSSPNTADSPLAIASSVAVPVSSGRDGTGGGTGA